MWPGTPGPRRRRGARPRSGHCATIPRSGGSTFAERPEVEAPEARIIWRAEIDPGTLRVRACPSHAGDPDAIDPGILAPWLTLVSDEHGEHAVLSDGWHHIRLDVDEGSLAARRPIVLEYRLAGIASAAPRILPLRRLIDLARRRRFAISLYPPDRRVERWIVALRVHDAVTAGASQREIGTVLYGERYQQGGALSDSLRSRVRRLVAEARRLGGGGYRMLLNRGR